MIVPMHRASAADTAAGFIFAGTLVAGAEQSLVILPAAIVHRWTFRAIAFREILTIVFNVNHNFYWFIERLSGPSWKDGWRRNNRMFRHSGK